MASPLQQFVVRSQFSELNNKSKENSHEDGMLTDIEQTGQTEL